MSAALPPEAAPAEQPELIPGSRAVGIKPLKRVSAYRTSDGAIFESRAEAERREAGLEVSAFAIRFTGGDVEEALFRNAEPLRDALSRWIKAGEKMQAPAAEPGA
jgi:hypothetical protein